MWPAKSRLPLPAPGRYGRRTDQPFAREADVRFRYFDPLQQSTVEGELSAGEVGELVGLVAALRADLAPALELTGRDGSSLVLGVVADRAVVLWTGADGTSCHSVGGPHDGRVSFDYFGAFTQVPGHYTVPLSAAVDAVRGYVRTGGAPSLPLAAD
jgi:hypothetical protein